MRKQSCERGLTRIDPRELIATKALQIVKILRKSRMPFFIAATYLLDMCYGYIDRPTEIEAYRYAVEEARNMSLSDQRICQYLKTEWMSNDELKQLAGALKVRCAF